MIAKDSKNIVRTRVHKRIRSRVVGSTERPRLNVYRSLNHLYVQVIDDMRGITLVSASTQEKKTDSAGAKDVKAKDEKAAAAKDETQGAKAEGKAKKSTGGNLGAAREIGRVIAERAKAKGVTRVVFDRGGYLYHGRIKALADAARAAGLEF
jgi:large subunit ribosomal protein L18